MEITNQKISEIQVSYSPLNKDNPVINSVHDAYVELIKFFPQETIALQEKVMAMYVNRANRVLGAYEVSSGGMTGTVVDIRLVLTVALKIAATGFILAHNHPSGNLKPSIADIELTAKVKEAGKLMDVRMLDHLIVSPSENEYCSFADDGLL